MADERKYAKVRVIEMRSKIIQEWAAGEWKTTVNEPRVSEQLNKWLDEYDMNPVSTPNTNMHQIQHDLVDGGIRVVTTFILTASVMSREDHWRSEVEKAIFVASHVAQGMAQPASSTPNAPATQQLGEAAPEKPAGLQVTHVELPAAPPPIAP